MLYEKLLPVAKGGPTDPYFYDVSLLLTGDGTNGAQNNTFLDSSTNNFTITRNGNTTQGSFSPYGNLWSNYFDGSGDYIVAADSTAFDLPGDYTLEFWVYPTALGSSRSFVCIGNGGNSDGLLLYWSAGDSKIKMYCGSTIIGGSITTSANTWTHVALVRSGSGSNNTTLYINGVSSGQATNTTSFTGVGGNGCSVGAAYYGSYSEETVGYFSNVRLVKGTAVYTTAFTPPTAPLTAISGTSLLTCQSNRFIDNSSNNFTLTVNGTPSVQRFSPFNPTAPYSTSTIGGSGYFDGSGDYLVASSASGSLSGDFTVEFWWYPMTAASGYNLFTGPATYTGQNYFGLNGTSWIVNIVTGSEQTLGTFNGQVNAWQHVALVRSGSSIKLYINGVGGSAITNANAWPRGGGTCIGGYGSNNFPMQAGYLSNYRVVDGTAVYTTNFTPPTAPVTAVSGTYLLTDFTNAGIPDAAMMNDLETVGNAQVSTSVKKYGTGSLYFDGSGDYLVSRATPNLNFGAGNFTVEFWLYPQSASLSGECLPLAAVDGSGNYSYAPYLTSGAITSILQTSGGGQVIPSTGITLSANTWYHIAYVRNGNTYTTYVNGTGYGATTLSGSLSDISYFSIGAKYQGSFPFTGYIDDLRVTKGYARYTVNFTPPTSALPTY